MLLFMPFVELFIKFTYFKFKKRRQLILIHIVRRTGKKVVRNRFNSKFNTEFPNFNLAEHYCLNGK